MNKDLETLVMWKPGRSRLVIGRIHGKSEQV